MAGLLCDVLGLSSSSPGRGSRGHPQDPDVLALANRESVRAGLSPREMPGVTARCLQSTANDGLLRVLPLRIAGLLGKRRVIHCTLWTRLSTLFRGSARCSPVPTFVAMGEHLLFRVSDKGCRAGNGVIEVTPPPTPSFRAHNVCVDTRPGIPARAPRNSTRSSRSLKASLNRSLGSGQGHGSHSGWYNRGAGTARRATGKPFCVNVTLPACAGASAVRRPTPVDTCGQPASTGIEVFSPYRKTPKIPRVTDG